MDWCSFSPGDLLVPDKDNSISSNKDNTETDLRLSGVNVAARHTSTIAAMIKTSVVYDDDDEYLEVLCYGISFAGCHSG